MQKHKGPPSCNERLLKSSTPLGCFFFLDILPGFCKPCISSASTLQRFAESGEVNFVMPRIQSVRLLTKAVLPTPWLNHIAWPRSTACASSTAPGEMKEASHKG